MIAWQWKWEKKYGSELYNCFGKFGHTSDETCTQEAKGIEACGGRENWMWTNNEASEKGPLSHQEIRETLVWWDHCDQIKSGDIS